MKKDVSERFWEKVDTSGGPDACWEWQRAKDKWGYGHFKFYIDGKFVQLSHRVAYYLANNELPADLCVCHRCDNPACCNPQHLFLGTVADNNQDMMRKGRLYRFSKEEISRGAQKGGLLMKTRSKGNNAPSMNGESNPQSKLTRSQVDSIREMRANGFSLKDIAAAFSVSTTNVHAICSWQLWK